MQEARQRSRQGEREAGREAGESGHSLKASSFLPLLTLYSTINKNTAAAQMLHAKEAEAKMQSRGHDTGALGQRGCIRALL